MLYGDRHLRWRRAALRVWDRSWAAKRRLERPLFSSDGRRASNRTALAALAFALRTPSGACGDRDGGLLAWLTCISYFVAIHHLACDCKFTRIYAYHRTTAAQLKASRYLSA